MDSPVKEQLDAIKKKIIAAACLSMPGGILLGLGMAGTASGPQILEEIHPMLANEKLITIMLLTGILSSIVCLIWIFTLERKKNKLLDSSS